MRQSSMNTIWLAQRPFRDRLLKSGSLARSVCHSVEAPKVPYRVLMIRTWTVEEL